MPLGRPLATWIASVTLGALVVGVVLARITSHVVFRGLGPWLLFGAGTLASMHLSPWAAQSATRATPSLLLLLVFPAAQVIAQSPGALRAVRACMAGAIVITAADLAWQPLFGSSLLLGVIQHPADPRFTGSLPNANEVGFVALLAPLAFDVVPLRSISLSVTSVRNLLIPAAALIPILLSASRATLGGYAVGACVRSWFGERRFVRWAPAAALCIAAVAWMADIGAFRHRLAETLAPQQESRLRTWSIAWNAFTEHPWFGNGPAVFFEVNEASRRLPQVPGWETPAGGMPWAHNIPLEILCERGLVGAVIFAAVIIQLIRHLRTGLQSSAQRRWAGSIAASAASFGAMSLLDMSFLKDWCTVCFWLTCGFAAAASADAMRSEATPATKG
jgi:O-antigen ligase